MGLPAKTLFLITRCLNEQVKFVANLNVGSCCMFFIGNTQLPLEVCSFAKTAYIYRYVALGTPRRIIIILKYNNNKQTAP